jgi:hypothetical protein
MQSQADVGGRFLIKEIAPDGIADHFLQVAQSVGLGVDTVPNSRRDIPTVDLVFRHFKNDFIHK